MAGEFPAASYDAWKTRSPDDELFDDDRPVCEHYDRRFPGMNLYDCDGTLMCRECADEYDRVEHERYVAEMSWRERLRYEWGGFTFWLRWNALPALWRRPKNAVRSWWQGWRRTPWSPDDEVPF